MKEKKSECKIEYEGPFVNASLYLPLEDILEFDIIESAFSSINSLIDNDLIDKKCDKIKQCTEKEFKEFKKDCRPLQYDPIKFQNKIFLFYMKSMENHPSDTFSLPHLSIHWRGHFLRDGRIFYGELEE